MKFKNIALFALIAVIGCSGSKDTTQQMQPGPTTPSTDTESLLSYHDEITTPYLRSHLTPFAADSMEGRETGMEGQKKAARYLSQQYEELGMKPVGDDGTYLQKFDLTAEKTDSIVFMTYAQNADGSQEKISESVGSKETTANYVHQYGGSNTIDAEIIFVGYGIQDQSLGIDQLSGLNVKGKWVMVLEGNIPQVVEGDTLYTDEQRFAQIRYRNLLQKGVAGILVIPDITIDEFEEAARESSKSFGEVSGMQLAYLNEQSSGPGWGLTMISPRHAAKVLNLSSGTNGLRMLRTNINQDLKAFKAKNTGSGLTQIPYTKDVTIETENVVALLEGADPELKDEVVVLSAHYDHVGIGEPDSTGDAIYNGANDDGSGTIGVLNAARAFSEAKENGVQPRRSVLFLSVSGEEKGLLGSRYYSDHPIYPIEKTVANINTDMIGRVDPEHRKRGEEEYVYIIGADIISSDLDSLLKAGNAKSGNLKLDMRYNDLSDPNQFYRRSDHWNFGRFGVPFVFFFNGVHEDYHQPSDEIDKMNWDLYTQTVRSMYATTVMVANADSAPKVDNQEFIEITKGN